MSFKVVLTPNRSLGPTGFLILMGAFGLVSFATGIVFLILGAWPVLGFFGLDVLLLYVAFKLNYRAGRQYETVEITARALDLERVDARGHAERFTFNPYWVRLHLTELSDGRNALSLTSHGRELTFATFLSDDERVELKEALTSALHRARTSSHPA